MQTIRIGDPVPLVLAAAPTALAERGPMFSKKGRAMATPVPFKKVRRSIFRIFMGEVQELIGKRDAYELIKYAKTSVQIQINVFGQVDAEVYNRGTEGRLEICFYTSRGSILKSALRPSFLAFVFSQSQMRKSETNSSG